MILKSNGNGIASDVEFANSLLSQTKGLMFRKSISDDYALVFVMAKPRIISIHMLFVRFPIDVLFLDENKRIVKTAHLRPWTGLASSSEKIKYMIEIPEGSIAKHELVVGEHLVFDVP
ncbi:MAG: DUF192 domain-containing protein [Methanosarcinaceae archaeon]|nr:DUF192 domain-containing protein [Methanosarcinaceae archaeon]